MLSIPLPSFTGIDLESFPAALDNQLANNIEKINTILVTESVYTWDNLMMPLEAMEDALERIWSPLSHLHGVLNTTALRTCYEACLPKLSAYHTTLGQHEGLFKAIQALDRHSLTATQLKIIDDALRDFELSGVALSATAKKRFEVIEERLSFLSNQFENNVLDCVNTYQLVIDTPDSLTGIPAHALHHARALAKEKGVSGWVFTLEFPCYRALITYADDRALRQTIYHAYMTRASDQGPLAGQFDNAAIMQELIQLRHEKARLVGFDNYASLSIATKMAESPEQVIDFLSSLIETARPQALQELEALRAFAMQYPEIDVLAPWDIAYLSEKKLQASHQVSQEMLRAYFPLPRVMNGLFRIIDQLYGMQFESLDGVDVWHTDVLCYAVRDSTGEYRGVVYLDLFARPNKRSGAWMDSLQSRRKRLDKTIQLPIATLTCNFTKPMTDQTATLSHDEVITLFHEMGHCLHHVLTQVDYSTVAGINGVEWDAVELPSQFFENWCWEKAALPLLSGHIQTGQPLPETQIDQLKASKQFQSALSMLRQVEFSLIDMLIHGGDPTTQPDLITASIAMVREKTAVLPVAPFNRFQHSFSHIFGGGYAAGYYSYSWADVLSCDAFARFEDEGLFNPQTGADFLRCILEVGGSRNAADSYACFRGRPATIDALLRQYGILGGSNHA